MVEVSWRVRMQFLPQQVAGQKSRLTVTTIPTTAFSYCYIRIKCHWRLGKFEFPNLMERILYRQQIQRDRTGIAPPSTTSSAPQGSTIHSIPVLPMVGIDNQCLLRCRVSLAQRRNFIAVPWLFGVAMANPQCHNARRCSLHSHQHLHKQFTAVMPTVCSSRLFWRMYIYFHQSPSGYVCQSPFLVNASALLPVLWKLSIST